MRITGKKVSQALDSMLQAGPCIRDTFMKAVTFVHLRMRRWRSHVPLERLLHVAACAVARKMGLD